MAKKKSGLNKSQAIRDYLTAHPGVGPKEVAQRLSEQGVAVSPDFVSVVKGKMKSGGKNKKQKRRVVKKPQQATAAAAASSSQGLNFGDLVATKRLVDQLGSAKQVRAALDALDRLR